MGELKERRLAVEEIKDEIMEALADIKEAIAVAIRPPAIVSHTAAIPDEAERERIRQVVEQMTPGSAATIRQGHTEWRIEWPGAKQNMLATLAARVERLGRLLGLSDAERAFVDDAAAAASEPGGAYETLMVFADWLEDRMRTMEAGEIRQLVPQTGDLLVCAYSGRRVGEAEHHAGEMMTRVVKILSGLGRDVACVVVPEGVSVTSLAPEELEGAGWVRKDEHGERLLRDALADQPDARRVGTIDQQAAYLIDSLKRENAELRRAVAAEREACAEAAEGADYGTDCPHEALRAAAEAIRGRPPV